MQNRYSNKFVVIISGCFLLLAAFVIGIKIEVRPSYALVNETEFTQQRSDSIEQWPSNFWRALQNNAEINLDNEKIWQIFGTKETAQKNLSG